MTPAEAAKLLGDVDAFCTEIREIEDERLQFIACTRVRIEILSTLQVARSTGIIVPELFDIFFSSDA